MDAISYTAARNNLAKTMDKVVDDHAPVLITRQNGAPVVMMSLDDYNALEETAHLLRSPANAERLMRSLRAAREGKAITFIHTLVTKALEGRGIGSRLIAGALRDVRAKGLQLIAQCPFVAAYIERHPEERDLLARG